MFDKLMVVGSGSWATALVKLFGESGIQVSWLLRSQELVDYIGNNGHHPRYLSFASLPLDQLELVTDPMPAIQEAGLVLFAVPSAYLRDTLNKIEVGLLEHKPVAVSIKGFVPGSGTTPSRFISQHIGSNAGPVMVIGGPCHAEEMANRKSTYMTVGGSDGKLVDALCKKLDSHYVHAIPNNDPVGIEYAAILKNIIGIACGIANGLHYGDNFQAVLVSNAMREIHRFIEAAEPGPRDLFQSAYFGDLLVTAYSEYSRNRTLGKLLGRGIQVGKALQAMEMIAEGFFASAELAVLIKSSKINLPVINAVHRILHQHANPFHEFKLLEEQLN